MAHICTNCKESTYMLFPVNEALAQTLAEKGIRIRGSRICSNCNSLITLMRRGLSEGQARQTLQDIKQRQLAEEISNE